MAAPRISTLGWVAIVGGGLFLASKALAGRGGVRAKTHGPYAIIGDSLAVGLAKPLSVALGQTVSGWGVGGSIAAMWTGQVEAVMVSNPPPKTVFVSLGTNDAVSPAARAHFADRISSIVQKIRAVGGTPVLLASPAKLTHIHETNAALAATGALVIQPPPSLQMQADGVHPTPAGYTEWAQAIAGAVA